MIDVLKLLIFYMYTNKVSKVAGHVGEPESSSQYIMMYDDSCSSVLPLIVGRRASFYSICLVGRTRLLVDVAKLPFESKRVELLDAIQGNVGRFAFVKELELASLAFYPGSQLVVVFVVAGNVAGSKLLSKLLEFFQTFAPSRALRVPHKANVLQGVHTFLCHGTKLSFVHELVLVSLSLDPSCQGQVGRVGVGDKAVTKLLLVLAEFSELFRPLSFLVFAKLGARAFRILRG